MSPKATGWDKLHVAENPAVDLTRSLGYTYVPLEDLDPERTSGKEPIFINRLGANRLGAALERLNPGVFSTNLNGAVKGVTQVPGASLAEANETLSTPPPPTASRERRTAVPDGEESSK